MPGICQYKELALCKLDALTSSSSAYDQDLLLPLVLHVFAHVEARLRGLTVQERLSIWHDKKAF